MSCTLESATTVYSVTTMAAATEAIPETARCELRKYVRDDTFFRRKSRDVASTSSADVCRDALKALTATAIDFNACHLRGERRIHRTRFCDFVKEKDETWINRRSSMGNETTVGASRIDRARRISCHE